jgi:hypothetical protein
MFLNISHSARMIIVDQSMCTYSSPYNLHMLVEEQWTIEICFLSTLINISTPSQVLIDLHLRHASTPQLLFLICLTHSKLDHKSSFHNLKRLWMKVCPTWKQRIMTLLWKYFNTETSVINQRCFLLNCKMDMSDRNFNFFSIWKGQWKLHITFWEFFHSSMSKILHEISKQFGIINSLISKLYIALQDFKELISCEIFSNRVLVTLKDSEKKSPFTCERFDIFDIFFALHYKWRARCNWRALQSFIRTSGQEPPGTYH